MAGPVLPNLEPLIMAGIDPKTGLPIKLVGGDKKRLKQAIKAQLRVKEENEFCNRFVWYNLPTNISSAELERMLYYKGQLCFFYNKDLDAFYFMPYALDGTIDFYGRYNRIHPVPMTSGTDDKGNKAQAQLLADIKLDCVYGVKMEEEIDIKSLFNSTVILRDYTNQFAQTIIPRQVLNDDLLDAMAECIPLMRTRLILGTGVKGVRVNDADQARSVEDGSRALERNAIEGQAYVPIVGNIEFQELSDNSAGKSEEYMQAYQSLDNLRKQTLGLPASGVFEKKAHMLAGEQNANGANVDLVLADGLQCRKTFANIVNSIWGLGIDCEIAESITNLDVNGDGKTYNDDETSQQVGPSTEGESNDNDATI